VPFFEHWTIWGAFAPVGYTQGMAQVHVIPIPALQLRAGGSYRNYDDTHTGVSWIRIEETGWSVLTGARWTPGAWLFDAGYDGMSNPGSFRSRVDVAMSRGIAGRGRLGLFGSATQQFERFRYGDGRSTGGGIEASVALGNVDLDGNAGWYLHRFLDRPGYDDYDQFQARLRLTVRFSTEPDAHQPWRSGASNRMRTVREAQQEAQQLDNTAGPGGSS
jgi:hypothetical protein